MYMYVHIPPDCVHLNTKGQYLYTRVHVQCILVVEDATSAHDLISQIWYLAKSSPDDD